MSTCEIAPNTPRITTRPAAAARVFNRLAALFRVWKNRRGFYQLCEMTDAELADIGLTRTDLRVAIEVPFGSDPTLKLRALAHNRKVCVEDVVPRSA